MASQITIRGSVNFYPNVLPADGMTVEFWDQVGTYGWIASCNSDKSGNFYCILNDPYASLIGKDGKMLLKFIVKKSGITILEGNHDDAFADLQIQIDNKLYDQLFPDTTISAAPVRFFNISGLVRDQNGAPCIDTSINVYENGFRTKTVIGSCVTDNNGRYTAKISTKSIGNSFVIDKSSIRIEAEQNGFIVGSADNIFDWSSNMVVNIDASVINTVSSFQIKMNQITKVTGLTPLDEIEIVEKENINEVKYISGATGYGEKIITDIVNAHKFAVETSLPADVMYALVQVAGNNVNPLLVLKPKKIREAIVNAVMNNVIAVYDELSIKVFLETALGFCVRQTKELGIEGEPYQMNDILMAIFNTQKDVDYFLQVHHGDFNGDDDFWDIYGQPPGSPQLVKKAKEGLKLGSITNYQPYIMEQILSVLGTDNLSKLATWTVAAWVDLIDKVCRKMNALCVPVSIRGMETLPTNKTIQEIYSVRLATISQAMYPLANIGFFLSTNEGGTVISDNIERNQVGIFINNNYDFDIRVTSVYDINSTDHDLTEIVDISALQTSLLPIARLAKVVGGNPFAIITLIQNNVTSSRDIATMGWSEFQSKYGYLFSPVQNLGGVNHLSGPCSSQDVPGLVPTSEEVYRKAVGITKGLTNAVGGAIARSYNAYPSVLGNGNNLDSSINPTELPIEGNGVVIPHAATATGMAMPHASRLSYSTNDFVNIYQGNSLSLRLGTGAPVISGMPTLENLIGNLDYDEVSDCKSIYSPAAYLTDTLFYLKSNAAAVYNIFDARRPDVKFIDLSCDNTNTPLPYIDLVNEQLEWLIMKEISATSSGINPSIIGGVSSFSFNTTTRLRIVDTANQSGTVDQSSPLVQGGYSSKTTPQATFVGTKNLAQNVINKPNNNVQVQVNSQTVGSPQNTGISSDTGAVKVSAVRVAGQQQAAYPERTYKDPVTGEYLDYTSYTYASGSGRVNAYDAIYGSLSGAVYPYSLPFNMPVEEARVYLGHFGSSRVQLMKLFSPVRPITYTGLPPVGAITNFSIYAEFLGLTQISATIVAGTHAYYTSSIYKFYGAASATAPGYIDPVTGIPFVPTWTVSLAGDNWQDFISARIDILLQQTGISYNELLQYLTTTYLNPFVGSTSVRQITVTPNAPRPGVADDTAALNQLRLTFNLAGGTTATLASTSSGISFAFYTKFHAFIRLVSTRKLDIYRWDILLRSIGVTGTSATSTIDNNTFLLLGQILTISSELNIAPEILTMFWNSADTVHYLNYPNNSSAILSSIYDDIFSGNAAIKNSSTNIFKDPSAAALGTNLYSNSLAQIANACGISQNDLNLLFGYLATCNSSLSLSSHLTLPVLSRLYILSQLSIACSLSISDFIDLLVLSGISVTINNISVTSDVSNFLTTLQTIIDAITAVNRSVFNIKELNYLIAGVDPLDASAPPPSHIRLFLESLRRELYKKPSIPTSTSLTIAATGQTDPFKLLANIVYQQFSKEFGISVAQIQSILGITSTVTVGSPGTNPNGILAYFLNSDFVASTYNLSEDVVTFIDSLGWLSAGTLIPSAHATGAPPNYGTLPDSVSGNKKPAFNLSALYQCYRYVHKTAFVYQKLGLRSAEFDYLFNTYTATSIPNLLGFNFVWLPVSSTYGGSLTTINGLTLTSTSGGGAPNTIDHFNALLRLSRMMDVVNYLSLPDAALGQILDALSGVSRTVTGFTVFTTPTSVALNSCFSNFLNVINQSNWDTKLFELFGNNVNTPPLATGTNTTYGTGTGAPTSLLNVLFSFGSFSSDFNPGDYKNISMILNAVQIVNQSMQIGLQPSTLIKLLTEDIGNESTRKLILAAQSKYDEAGWNNVAKPLRDIIRIKQRDALVAYTRKTSNDLFAELLIDVEMDPCMITSRLKQAISSLQLFVDRVVMGLEKNGAGAIVTLPVEVQNEWQSWRKWYRIWQANREVFFYPEDWMEPELRDDKTPFFLDLEAELKQNALTTDSAESALSNYLHKLDDVAKLQPVGTCQETLADGVTVVIHIISRTFGASHTYYHRTVVNNIWSPWEKIGLQIAGDHVVPFVWNNRLCLYWLTFTEKAAPFTELMNTILAAGASSYPQQWFFNDAQEIGTNTIGSATSPVVNYYKQLHVTLNWSEYKGGKWQNMNVGKENILLKINPFLDTLTYNCNVDDQRWILNFATNNGHTTLMEMIKSRIFMYPYVHSVSGLPNNDATGGYDAVVGDLYIMLTYPTDCVFNADPRSRVFEYADYLKCFHFSGSTNFMNVPNDTMFYKRVATPNYTLIKNQALVSRAPGLDLAADTLYHETSRVEWMYNYQTNRGVPVPIGSMDRAIAPVPIVTPRKSNYRVVPNAGYTGLATDSPFLFEDSDNIFYVSKSTYVTPLVFSTSSIPIGLAPANAVLDKNAVASISGRTLDIASRNFQMLPRSSVSSFPGSPPSAGGVLAMPFGGTLTTNYFFTTLYHHHVHVFRRMLNQYGIKGLYRPDLLNLSPSVLPIVQAARSAAGTDDDTIDFAAQYNPATSVAHIYPPGSGTSVYPNNRVNFDNTSAYGVYNWELFFHVPMMIAQRLSDNLQFMDAQKWYHFIFDPTSTTYLNWDTTGTGAQRFWKFYPFYQIAASSPGTLATLLDDIRNNTGNGLAQVNASSKNPFDPFMIGRLRPLAFMKNVLMNYLDNLIAWGDHLFARDTIESINEATQLYILASNILGKKPTGSIQRTTTKPKSFNDLLSLHTADMQLDAIGDACVQIEAFIDPGGVYPSSGPAPSLPNMHYFGLPPNNKLLTYWEKVADRLYKIRHCQNINGVVQRLPLFDAPIDPSLLVQAAAAGLSASDVLDDVSGANTPNYRFTYMVQKANEFTADVKALGGALLSALEKSDGEQLAVLRQGQELSLLNAVQQMKQRQIDEAQANYDALVKTRENTLARLAHYTSLISNSLIDLERKHLQTIQDGKVLQRQLVDLQQLGHFLALLPQFHAQLVGGVGASIGGQHFALANDIASTAISGDIALNNLDGSLYSTKGGFERRKEDWQFQMDSAKLEVEQLEKQLAAAKIRIEIAQNELENQKMQIENASKVNDFMQFKYTNQELYDWMAKQLATTYYGAYQIAYGLAKKALLCYRNELPTSKIAKTNLITPGYWDSRRKGLLAGEQLQLDIRNMEQNYIQDNVRTFELTKHISLAQLSPYNLLTLQKTGFCSFSIPEEWFDLDYPGHVNRTIKSVSISIPCVSGPYTSIPCTLTLTESSRRPTASSTDPLTLLPGLPPCSSIATSTAQNDNGMFDFSFRDERYLPFEGAGAVSKWNLSLFNSLSTSSAKPPYASFDLDSISDVILHMKYTAQNSGSDSFQSDRKHAVDTYLTSHTTSTKQPLGRIFSLKHEFGKSWYFYSQAFASSSATAWQIQFTPEQFPLLTKGKTIVIQELYFGLVGTSLNGTPGYILDAIKVPASGATTHFFPGGLALNGANNFISGNDTSTIVTSYNCNTDYISITLSSAGTPVNMATLLDNLYMVVIYKLS